MTADYLTLNAAKSRVHYSPLPSLPTHSLTHSLTHPVTPESHSHSVALGFRDLLLLLLKSDPRTFSSVEYGKGERASASVDGAADHDFQNR